MYTVLFVEPDEVNAARIRTILDSVELNFEYDVQTSAEEAIASVEHRRPDVFVGDMHIPVMSGMELFSMVKMMAPDTVFLVMTDGGGLRETVNFMNNCEIFKIIMKPCRLADDLLPPIHAAFSHKEEIRKRMQEEQAEDQKQDTVAEAYEKATEIVRMKQEQEKQAANLMASLAAANVDTDGSLEPEVKERLKRWYQWMIEEYVHVFLNGSGNYEQVLRQQTAFCNQPKSNCTFQMKKNTAEEIEARCMNEIAYILKLVTGICKDLQRTYRIQALIDANEKAYIVRVRYQLTKDENGQEIPGEQRVKNPVLRRELARATRLAIAALGGKTAVHHGGQEDIVSIAVHKTLSVDKAETKCIE